jgi:hypothetical protein
VALYKFTFISQIQRHSFSESWYHEASNTNLNALVPKAREYCQARALMLGAPCYIYAFRISDVSSVVDRALLIYETFLGIQTKDSNGNFIHGAAASNVALNALFQNADGSKEKLIQLRGIWDDVEFEGGAFRAGEAEFQTVFINYAVKVRQLGFGWLAKSGASIVSPLASYAIQANGVLRFSFSGGFFNLAQTPVGTHVPIRLRGMVDSKNLNGPITVVVTGADSADTLKPIAARPWISSGQAVRNNTSPVVADSGRIQRIGKRQAGAPLLQSVGRSSNRARG